MVKVSSNSNKKETTSLKTKNKCEDSCNCSSITFSKDIREEDLKDLYIKLQKKYQLPSYEELNEYFEISKSEFDRDTLIRDIRKSITSKIFSAITFVELLLNPSNASMFYMFLVKGIGPSEKEILNKVFNKLGEIQIESFYLELDYNEEKEAEFVKNTFVEWKSIIFDLTKVIDVLKLNWKKDGMKKSRSYFG
ncbi:MAG: hypothetical protein QXJ28_01050 [Candidatus Pacearchaeota archaeon]